jgi:RhtB (resistance to homoserine/threonine) family protein
MEANQPAVNPRVTLDAMGAHLLVFVGVAAIVILLPGPDTAVVTKNVLLHGRRAALGASAGVGAGLSVWTLAAAVGLASVIRASEVAFTVLKVAGALYLMWLGFQALRAARHAPADDEARRTAARPDMGARGGFWQGFLSDLANPKIGIFFTSLLPQFVDPGRPVLLPFLALGAVFVLMTVAWLGAYCLVAARAAETLRRPRVRSALDRVTGVVLIAIGLRLVTEHR